MEYVRSEHSTARWDYSSNGRDSHDRISRINHDLESPDLRDLGPQRIHGKKIRIKIGPGRGLAK
ncbi:Hypothetical protein PHPALM_6129 [Phytophthora palmivora]|uniref:Uncharacterized protein n=1 Tax=Phytophthora palmivora TaxID=4796 RepID=A0A2P4YFP3_9STRA|nr:Hypothetical protein PHPALM_6129 [Phytophthora palmivora]